MPTDNAEAGLGAKPTSKPTAKQRRFAAAYVDPSAANGNGTLAARIAGYKGNSNQLGVQAHENLKNPKIRKAITSMLNSMTERALQRANEALDATSSRVFLDKESLVYSEPVPDHRVRLGAAHLILDLQAKCDVAEEEHDVAEVAEDSVAEQINPADQPLLEEAAAIDAELGELDSALNDGGDHDREHDEDPDE